MKSKQLKLTLSLLVVTFGAFALSSVCAAIAGVESDHGFPTGVAVRYSKAFSNGKEVKLHRDFPLGNLEELQIEATAVNLEIAANNVPTVSVDIEGTFSPKKGDDERVLKSKTESGRLYLKTDESSSNDSIFHFNLQSKVSHMKVKVPATVKRVTLKTVSGDIHLDRFQFESLSVGTVSGSVHIEELKSASLQLKSISGDVVVSGDILKVETSSVSGDQHFNFANASPSLTLNSTSGDVRVHFEKSPDLKLVFHSVSGELQVDDKLGTSVDGRQKVDLTLGKGTGLVSVKTVSGDMSVTR